MKFLGARPQHEDLKLLVEDSDAVENNLAKFDSSGNPVDSGIASNTVPIATTDNLTFYVNPSTGNDNNNGSSGSPFKTIAKAVSMIPQIVNHDVKIYLADGNYSEGITLSGYAGSGVITITGNTTNPENVVFSGMVYVHHASIQIKIEGLESTTSVANAFYVVAANHTRINNVIADASSSNDGLRVMYSFVYVYGSVFSNKENGINGHLNGYICSYNNSGTGNTTGLKALNASTIGKNGSQPAGTTAEAESHGGEIR